MCWLIKQTIRHSRIIHKLPAAGNNVPLHGYIRKIAQGHTKLSIFNAPVCIVRSVRERETCKLFLHSLPLSLPPSLMNYQCFEVISMQRPDSKLGSQPVPCRHMKEQFQSLTFCCVLSHVGAAAQNTSVHPNHVTHQMLTKGEIFQVNRPILGCRWMAFPVVAGLCFT